MGADRVAFQPCSVGLERALVYESNAHNLTRTDSTRRLRRSVSARCSSRRPGCEDAERRGRAFPRRAWERGGEVFWSNDAKRREKAFPRGAWEPGGCCPSPLCRLRRHRPHLEEECAVVWYNHRGRWLVLFPSWRWRERSRPPRLVSSQASQNRHSRDEHSIQVYRYGRQVHAEKRSFARDGDCFFTRFRGGGLRSATGAGAGE